MYLIHKSALVRFYLSSLTIHLVLDHEIGHPPEGRGQQTSLWPWAETFEPQLDLAIQVT